MTEVFVGQGFERISKYGKVSEVVSKMEVEMRFALLCNLEAPEPKN